MSGEPFTTPGGVFPRGLPDAVDPADVVVVTVKDAQVDVHVGRALAAPTPDGDGRGPELGVVTSFWMDVDDFLRTFKSLVLQVELDVRPPGRRERCPCGSGARYNKCHGRQRRSAPAPP